MNISMHNNLTNHARLWQLISPALPVGAYAYSAGLEYAVDIGWVDNEEKAYDWILGQLQNSLSTLDAPILARLYKAWLENDSDKADYWSRFLLASRESSELLAEDRQMGNALAQLLPELGIAEAVSWRGHNHTSFCSMFALGAVHWKIPVEEAMSGYLWAWCENQVAAAIKLIPLGQTAGQRILANTINSLPAAVEKGLLLSDDEIGAVSPGLAMASARHEIQYSRLFRS
jgi:urease accessory protein